MAEILNSSRALLQGPALVNPQAALEVNHQAGNEELISGNLQSSLNVGQIASNVQVPPNMNLITSIPPPSVAKVSNCLLTISPFPSSIIKLDEENFLVWKSQILPILRGHKLDKYVFGAGTSFMDQIADFKGEITEDFLQIFTSD